MTNYQDELQKLKAENRKLFEELKRKKTKLTMTLKEIEEAHDDIKESHRELSDSVNYAKRIQLAIMPPRSIVNTMLKDNFIMYLPKDVVSGDFYFVEKIDDDVIFAVVDCTGHGVPGALLSVVGFNCLDRAVLKKGITRPCDILGFLDEAVNNTLRQTADESGVKDGMDLGLCTLDTRTNTLQFSGAYNPAYIIKTKPVLDSVRERTIDASHPRNAGKKIIETAMAGKPMALKVAAGNGEDESWIAGKEELVNEPSLSLENYHLFEIKADKLQIGVNIDGVVDIYTNHTIQLEKGDTVYLFSDGYADQFGGPHVKKFKGNRFKKLLLSIQDKPMTEQKRMLVKTFSQWKSGQEQIDDVLVMGVKI